MSPHIPAMITVLSILLGAALLAVVGVLMTGVVVFARGGEANRRWANRLMNLRVAVQAVVVLLLGALMLAHKF
ncbi:HIG1 domain-containing protein [Telmatospirillum siberiense]|nr:HIG1 domain-containing protein [Telmatospirillum siberiense]